MEVQLDTGASRADVCVGLLHHILYMRRQVPRPVKDLRLLYTDQAQSSVLATTRRIACFLEILLELEICIHTVETCGGHIRGMLWSSFVSI
jgi:hypothetical protein